MNDLTPTREQRDRRTRRHGLQAQAGRGHPLHAGQGQLRRRRETAGHAARRFRPLAARACARQEDRRYRGAEGARRARRHHRRDAEDRQPRLDADARRRRADGARRRQGAVPEPGSRLRRRDRSLRGRRRHQQGGGRIRTAAAVDRSVQGDGQGCAGAARGSRRQDHGRPRPAQAPQPHLRVDRRRQGNDRRCFQEGRGDDQGDDLLSSHPSVAAGDLPVRLLVRQDQGRADDLGHLPGAACHPDRRGADRENSGAEDPCDLAGHRRRLRQQGRRLSRLYLRRGGFDRHGEAGEMGRGPHREPDRDLVRARLSHDDRDRRDQGGQGHRPARPRAGRSRRVRRLRRSVEMAGRLLQHRDGIVRLPDRASCGRRHLHQQGAGRRRLSLLVPRHRGGVLHRARDGYPGAEARHGSGGTAAEEFHQAGAVPVSLGASAGNTIPATIIRPCAR